MRTLVTPAVAALAAVISISVWMRQGWALAALCMVLIMWLLRVGRCPHPRPLGLLPPTTDANGRRTPAQWYCGQCGERFPAVFEHDHAPIQPLHGNRLVG